MTKRALTFVDGIGVGLGVLMTAPLLVYLAFARDAFIGMYKDMKGGALPTLTTIVFGSAWGYGVPIVLVVGFALALWLRPPSWVLFVLGALALVLSIVTYVGAYLPIFQLSGNIR